MFRSLEAIALLALVFLPMLVEARRSARNERTQRARGGIEPAGDVYGVMQAAYPAIFLAMIAEDVLRDRQPAFAGLAPGFAVAFVSISTVAGVVLFFAAKALKWWAILSLGRSWTFRVIVVPGDARVTRGPYAFLRHPNYAAVVGELVGVALMSGARITGPIGTLVFCGLMLKRVGVEERALRQARGVR